MRPKFDPSEAVRRLKSADPILCKLISAVGPCELRPRRNRTPFQALVQAVIYQQLNGTAARTILGRVKALFPGNRLPTPEELLAMPDDRLRGAGLSRAKTAAIKDIAAKQLSGVVPLSQECRKLSDAEIVERLVQIRGVGPWTAEMFLIFTLGRPDVLPATDFGVRKGFSIVYGWKDLPSPKDLLAEGDKWRPYRSVAAWYFWRALDLDLPRAEPGTGQPTPADW